MRVAPRGRFKFGLHLAYISNTNYMGRLITYLRETRAELAHVSWPTQKQTVIYTLLVVGISVSVSLFLGFFDFLFTRGIDFIISH